jgi:hypothetical protein
MHTFELGRRMAMALAALLAVAAAPATAQTPTTPVAPTYVVVEGQSTESPAPRQTLTVLCPSTHRALGAGYSALVRAAPAKGATAPSYIEVGLDRVRSMPDSAGTGWQVEGYAQEAAMNGASWKLAVRVVCLRAPM